MRGVRTGHASGYRSISPDQQPEPEEVQDVKMIVQAKRRTNPIRQKGIIPRGEENCLVMIRKVNSDTFILVNNPVPPRLKPGFPTHCQVRRCSSLL